MTCNTLICIECKTTGVEKWNTHQYYINVEKDMFISEYCIYCEKETLHSKEIPNKILSLSKSTLDIKCND